MQIKARNHLSKKDKRALIAHLTEFLGEEIINSLQKDIIIEEVRTDIGTFIVNNSKIWVFDHENMKIPTIHFLRQHTHSLPKIVVDIGAIRFITNGADVMAPGIVFFDEERTLSVFLSGGRPIPGHFRGDVAASKFGDIAGLAVA